MLSVRRRQEDAAGRGGGVAQLRGGMDDDAELEEGEACGDDTAFVDPDVALSYIVSRSRLLQKCRGLVCFGAALSCLLLLLPVPDRCAYD
jgi:hypothetical protein